jgi:hypothetical protein
MTRNAPIALLIACLAGLHAADDPAPAVAPAPAATPAAAPAAPASPATKGAPGAPPAAKPKEGDALEQLAEEERWTFDPQISRKDIFYDLEAILGLPNPELVNTEQNSKPTGPNVEELAALRDFGRQELSRIEGVVLGRKWDDALKYCEIDLKKLQSHGDDPQIAAIIEKIKRYQTQAEEAKIYEEAQAKFDALNLRIEGILWSATGSLAVISGEPRARAINDRVKDCVIISIDTNRVDFLYHYNRRRFEFQRYVGEDVTPGLKSK